MTRYIFIMVSIIFFTGCTYSVYHPIPPTTPEGISCVKICEGDEYQCSIKEQEYKKHCKRKNDINERYYQRCIDRNSRIHREIRDYCKRSKDVKQCIEDQKHVYQKLHRLQRCRIPKRDHCYDVDLECEQKYKRCFLNCGGSYYEEKREMF